MIMINCFLIMAAFVIISDKLQFWNNFSSIISGWMTNGKIKKPIPSKIMTCSTCQSWWVNLVYIILMHKLTIPMVVYILTLAYLAPILGDFLTLVTETLKNIMNKIMEIIEN